MYYYSIVRVSNDLEEMSLGDWVWDCQWLTDEPACHTDTRSTHGLRNQPITSNEYQLRAQNTGDGYQLRAENIEDGYQLTAQKTGNGYQLTAQNPGDGYQLTAQKTGDWYQLRAENTGDGYQLRADNTGDRDQLRADKTGDGDQLTAQTTVASDHIAAALGHNSIVLCCWRSRSILRHVYCSESCILYPFSPFGCILNFFFFLVANS